MSPLSYIKQMFWIRGMLGVKESPKHPFILVPNAEEPSFVRLHPDLGHSVGEICSLWLFSPLEGLFLLCLAQPVYLLLRWAEQSVCCWLLGEGTQGLHMSPLCSQPQTSQSSAASKSPGACLGCRISGLTSIRSEDGSYDVCQNRRGIALVH